MDELLARIDWCRGEDQYDLTRGIGRVKQERLWLTTAFNLKQRVGLIRSEAGPPDTCGETE